MSQLIKWQAPFADAFFPSVVSAFTQRLDGSDQLTIVVMPGGINEYPRYLVNFYSVLVFSCFDEGCAPAREWPEVGNIESKPCAWQWIDSPWVKSYQPCGNHDADGNPDPLHHYLIFGGDNIVEVISRKEPVIEEVWTGHSITTELSF